ncbi:MAG: D-alanyl-D-alanine carboxypeptidase [Xanthobacteraceae bacterium]|nr:D-alanyl-D-alanine carboxypeptidase [Xanthobacteraceae bacterium]
MTSRRARRTPELRALGVRALKACSIAGLIACLTAASFAAPAPKREGDFNTAAPTAILIDAESGTVLFERNADELVPPASLSKLMTQEVVFNELAQGRLKLDDEFLVSTNAWRTGGAPSRTSSMFAPINSRVRVEDLLRGAIVQSGNDACIALAEGIARSEDKFAALMTRRAREIGLTKSTFGNSTGLPDDRQRMTARELARLARHIIRTYPEYYKIYGEREFTFNKIRQFNRNPLLPLNIGVDGLKTGFVREAGYGLVASAVQNELRLIVVVNGLKSEKERSDEARRLLEWGFNNFQTNPLFADGQVIAHAKVYGSGSVPLVAGREVKLMSQRGVRERIVARVVYTGPVRPPVQKGQRIGALKVWRGDSVVLEVPLQAAEPLEQGGLPRRALDAVVELFYGLFRAGIQRL